MNPATATDQELRQFAEIGAAVIARLGNQLPENNEAPLTLTETAAAKRLGVSPGFFKTHVLSELRVIRKGARVLVPVSELERWVDRNAARTVE